MEGIGYLKNAYLFTIRRKINIFYLIQLVLICLINKRFQKS